MDDRRHPPEDPQEIDELNQLINELFPPSPRVRGIPLGAREPWPPYFSPERQKARAEWRAKQELERLFQEKIFVVRMPDGRVFKSPLVCQRDHEHVSKDSALQDDPFFGPTYLAEIERWIGKKLKDGADHRKLIVLYQNYKEEHARNQPGSMSFVDWLKAKGVLAEFF